VNPNAITATRSLEASILGAILLRPEIVTDLPRLETDDFFDLRHRSTFAAIRNLEATGTPIDVVTVVAQVAKWAGHNDSVTMEFLGTLLLDVPNGENVLEYARQLRQVSLARRVSIALGDVLEQAKRRAMDGGEMLSMAHAALSSIDEDQPDTATSIAALAAKRFKQLEQIAQDRRNGGLTLTGFPTGVAKLDEKIGGVQPGIVTIVAARPGMGKSSLGLSMADGASSAGFGVHVFSLEDTEESYADRTLSRTSLVPAETMRNADLNVGQCGDITLAAHKLKGRRWIVDGRSGVTADEIVRSVRRHRRTNNTCVVIVDYVQLVKRSPRQSPHEALSEIITTLADAAKQDRLAYVVMSQLNRQVESRQDKRPQLSDLRESGSLEERSKCVIGIYRGAYYGKPIKGIDYDDGWNGHSYPPGEEEHQGQVQLQVLKNSNGRTGTVFASWTGATTRIA
jgi:replicative DNA helicase